MKRSHAIIVGTLIVAAICITFLLLSEKPTDSHKSDHAEVIADNDTLKAHGFNYQRITDSLTRDNRRLDSANKSLIKGQANKQRQLDSKTAEVRTLVAQIREINQDTGYFGHLLDSLEEQVQNLTFLIVQYEQYADSINNVNDSMKVGFDAMIKEKDKRIAEIQATYDKLFKAYNELFATTTDLQKDLRRQKLKTKVAAVLGGALSLLALIK